MKGCDFIITFLYLMLSKVTLITWFQYTLLKGIEIDRETK